MHFRPVSTPQLAGKIQKVQEIRYTKLVARVLPAVVYVANLVTWSTAPGWAGDNGQSCWSSKCNLLTVARSELTKAGTLSCARHPGTRGHTTAAVRVLRFLHRRILIFSFTVVFRSHNILLGEGIPCPQTTLYILHVPSCKGGGG